MEKEKALIWKSQVQIPFSVSNKVHAFLGPLPNRPTNFDKLRKIFPCYYCTKPHIFLNKIYDLSFMSASSQAFRSTPYTSKKGYIGGSTS